MSKSTLRVAVTGANGKLGRPVVESLIQAGHEVVGIDRSPSVRSDILFAQADLSDYGQTHDVLGSVGWDILGDTRDGAFDVVVHLAAIPHPRMFSNSVTFNNNIAVAYNVFEACRRLGLNDVVLASSETVLGVPFSEDLAYVPLDEESPRRGRNAYQEFLIFLRHVARTYPDQPLHLIMDNYAAHKHPNVKVWLAANPRIQVHFTPTSGSWLNLVEVWFGIIERQAIHRGTFPSVRDLMIKIRTFINGWNDRCQPFTWTKTADQILAKAHRQTTSDSVH